VKDGDVGNLRPLPIDSLGAHYRRYRLADPAAEEAMARSLRRYGQLAPVFVCLRDGRPELLDGFKRWAAAPAVPLTTLSARVLTVDERTAKAAIFGLNSLSRTTHELEEAWIVQALVREDGLSQVEVAELLGRHKSWVCRRLALLEKLTAEAKEDLRLGLVSVTLARQLTRLPAGNQTDLLAVARRDVLTATEVRDLVELLHQATPEQARFVLDRPREALQQAAGIRGPIRDPRLSPGGNRVAKQLALALDVLARLENWLRYPGLHELKLLDRRLLVPQWERLARDTRSVSALVDDLFRQLELP
jgi:ParB-like chromosome segregation protein Spo0J